MAKRPMKLGFFIEPTAPNSNYRVIMPMLALERRGHDVIWPSNLANDVPLGALFDCDLVHCFRRLDRTRDLKQLSARGVAISFDNDDYLAAIDVSSTDSGGTVAGSRGRLMNARKFADILKLARFADLTTTPSDELAAGYRQSGAENVAVIENYLDDSAMSGFGTRAKHEGIVVGWVAAREHEADLPRLTITDALERLLDKHTDLRVLTVGAKLPLRSERYEHLEQVPFHELLRVIGRIDIGIAPLADTPFNRARSNVKLKEYAAAGAPWLASPVGPYREMGRGRGGRLVEDDDWYGALDGLIRSGFKRRRRTREAMRWARSQTVDAHASTWEQAFVGAIEHAGERNAGSSARQSSLGPRRRAMS
jgi:glycosyltransferase involved in cell wall biosynthesis